MPQKPNRFIYTVISLLITSMCFAASNSIITPQIKVLLDTLDSNLARADVYRKAHQEEIASLRHRLESTTDLEPRYWTALNLFEMNRGFDSDSALHYADICYDIASRLGRRDLKDDINLKRVYIYSATGMLSHADQALAAVDKANLTGGKLLEYYGAKLFLETHSDQYFGRNVERVYSEEVFETLKNVCDTLREDAPESLWLIGWRRLGDSSFPPDVLPKLESGINASRLDSKEVANDAWLVSRLHELENDSIGKLEYLIKAAIADIRSSNKEIASLEEIGAILKDHDDLERANAYISYSIQCANDYKSRVRVGYLARLQQEVLNAQNRQIKAQLQKIKSTMLVIGVISLVLLLAIIYICLQVRQLWRTRKALAAVKVNLEERVVELQDTRNELENANSKLTKMYEEARSHAEQLTAVNNAKETYIANVFALCSSYINKLDDFRKNIYRMIVAKRMDDVFALVKSPDLSHSEVKELYANFDKIFLQIYPNFVEDFNSLLRPEERTVLKSGELLNTELRIYALVRLGMTDSVTIAKFLHCSVQTVYNTRQRARNKAIVPKDGFVDAVRSLGKH